MLLMPIKASAYMLSLRYMEADTPVNVLDFDFSCRLVIAFGYALKPFQQDEWYHGLFAINRLKMGLVQPQDEHMLQEVMRHLGMPTSQKPDYLVLSDVTDYDSE